LFAAGALAQSEGMSWVFVSAVMYAGVLGGDSMIFLAGRKFGGRLLASKWFRRIFPESKHAKVEQLFEKHGSAGLFVGRFLPGLRAPLFFSAGMMRVSFLKFLCFDGFAALISVPVFVWLGHWLWGKFHDDIEAFNKALARTHSYALWGALGIVAIVVVCTWIWARRRRQRREMDESVEAGMSGRGERVAQTEESVGNLEK